MELLHKIRVLLFGGLNDTQAWNDVLGHVGHANVYLILFLVVFAETGLVVTPLLPGDSLLFAIGAVGARDAIALDLPLVTVLLIVAAIAGDAVNYWIGYKLGPAVFKQEETAEAGGKRTLKSRLLNKKHLVRAQEFYEKYGAKTIILARFVPVVRTFAPFVAGVGRMSYLKFLVYNVVGAIAWVLICVLAGVFFGRNEFVQKNFELVILAVIFISVLPMVVEVIVAWRRAKAAAKAASEARPG